MDGTELQMKILAMRKRIDEKKELCIRDKINNHNSKQKPKRPKSTGQQVSNICKKFETGEGLNLKDDVDSNTTPKAKDPDPPRARLQPLTIAVPTAKIPLLKPLQPQTPQPKIPQLKPLQPQSPQPKIPQLKPLQPHTPQFKIQPAKTPQLKIQPAKIPKPISNSFLFKTYVHPVEAESDSYYDVPKGSVDVDETYDVPTDRGDDFYDTPKNPSVNPIPEVNKNGLRPSNTLRFRKLDRSSTMSSKQSNSSSSSSASGGQSSFLYNHLNKINIDRLSDSSGIVEDKDYLSISSEEEKNNIIEEPLYESIEGYAIYENPETWNIKDDDGSLYETLSDKECDEFGTCENANGGIPEVSAINNGYFNKVIEEVPNANMDKQSRKLTERVMELLHTESLFVEKLRHVVRDYMVHLDDPDTPRHIAELKGDIFSNIDKLYRFHSREFLPALRKAQNDLKKLGQAFVEWEERFGLYLEYARNSTKANKLFVLNRDYFKNVQEKFNDKLDLSSYLLEPVQRLPRYELFLNDLVETYSNYEDELKINGSCRNSIASFSGSSASESTSSSGNTANTLDCLKRAKEVINKLLRKVNNTIAMENIRDCQINLLDQGELLRQDEFTVTDKLKNTCQMRCFLFEKLLVFTLIEKKPPVELFLFKDSISMTDLGLTPNSTVTDLSFRVWHTVMTNKPYKLSVKGDSTHIRDAWVNKIRDLLLIQAQIMKDKLLEKMNQRTITRRPIPIVPQVEESNNSGEVNKRDSGGSESSGNSPEYIEIWESNVNTSTSNRKKRKKKVSNTNDAFSYFDSTLPGSSERLSNRKIRDNKRRTTWYIPKGDINSIFG